MTELAKLKKATTVKRKSNLRFIDTETTGLNYDDEIVELAILNYDKEVLYHSFIKPAKATMDEEARAVNKIKDSDIDKAPSFADAWAEIKEYLDGSVWVFYNSDFDVRMMRQSLIANNLKEPFGLTEHSRDTVICAMRAFAELSGKRKWNSLVSACDYFDIDIPEGTHRADVDAKITADVAYAIADASRK